LLPCEGFDIGVADVTLSQFETLAKSLGRSDLEMGSMSLSARAATLSRTMVSLDNLLKTIPLETNLLFDLAYPSAETISSSLLTRQDLNAFVDAVLEKIFDVSDQLETQCMRRKITFTSFSSDVCSALNWKQPNCIHPTFIFKVCH